MTDNNQNGSNANTQEVIDSLTGDANFDALSRIEVPSEVKSNGFVREILGDEAEAETEVKKETNDKPAESSQGSDQEKNSAPPKPILRAKSDTGELEVPEDAAFTIKVDGKEQTLTLKELVRDAQQRIPWSRRDQELRGREAKFKQDSEAIDNWIKKVVELVKTEPKKALEELIVRAGGNPAEYEVLYADELEGLDDKTKKAVLASKGLEHNNKKLLEEKQAREAKDQELAIQQQVAEFLTTKQKEHNISNEELQRAWEAMNEIAKTTDMSKFTGLQSAEMLIDTILKVDRPHFTLVEATKQLEGVTVTDEDWAWFKKHIDFDLDKNDIAEIIKTYYGIDKNVSVEDSPPTKEPTKESAPKATSPKAPQKKDKPKADEDEDDDPKTFEDLLKPYR